MENNFACRICNGSFSGRATQPQEINGWVAQVCSVCGPIGYSREAWDDFDRILGGEKNRLNRAALSHLLSNADREGAQKHYFLTSEQLTAGRDTLTLPTPPIQRLNFIRIIGDHLVREGKEFVQEANTVARVGSFSNDAFAALYEQMKQKGLIIASKTAPRRDAFADTEVWYPGFDLTLEGWELYESGKRGKEAGHYGFVALQFGQPELNTFLAAVTPGILEETGYPLKDVLKFQRAGIIDNIMRDQIRNAAFVVADLTHGNKGAYW
ncbi:hypothetical protein [Asticcacaulis taihuensis]|uniref:hypothetical protein n=1 Tax=Asticcacaulis taihuensis TaxID=260084 RepID=UPI0026F08366|nr:hypothetical protein [Asticcacaulis taihuensis]